MHNDIVLSVIIPVKISDFNTFLYSRLERFIGYFDRSPEIEYVVIDSTKIDKYSKFIKEKIANLSNATYIYVDIEEPYSAAIARNRGADVANGEYLIFYDIDLIAKKNYFLEILKDIENLSKINSQAFTIYPCLYLTENYTSYIEENFNIESSYELLPELSIAKKECLAGIKAKVLYPAINTSTILVNKMHFINIGGYDEEFSGHGYEDFFLIHVLSYYYPLSLKDSSYFLDDKTDYPALYRGFRQYFSYYSLENLFADKFTAHLYHERSKQRSYYIKRDFNSLLFQSKLENLGISINRTEYILYKDYQKFIVKLIKKYGYQGKEVIGLYKPLLNNSLKNRIYRLYRKARKLTLNPKIFFADIRLEKYRYEIKFVEKLLKRIKKL